jgi:HlyD family secretion protein
MIKKLLKPTKKKVIILVILVVIVAGIAYSASIRAKAKGIHPNVSYSTLKKTTIQDTISVTGTVQSDDSTNVYTTLTLPVEKINVDVGDVVKKGDVLAILDTSGLQKDVEQQQYATKDANDSASLALQKAQSDYDNAVYQYNHDLNSGILTAKSQADSAKSALDAETSTWQYDQFLYQNGQLSKMDLDQEQTKYNKAKSDSDTANKSLASAQNSAQQELKTAKNAYDTAVAKYADKSQQAALEKLEQNLQDATVVAPVDGTVTYKNATVGVAPTGILFKVENTGNLVVNTEVKELDTAKLRAGDKVSITSDATGSTQIPGVVSNVAPAATESTEGTGDVTFTSKVKVTGKNPNLKIGMKAKMNIIMEAKPNVYVVSYDSLITNDDGSSSVMIAEKVGSLYKAKVIPVKTGMETDVSVEVSGNGLTDGVLVLNSPDGIHAGDTLQLAKEG